MIGVLEHVKALTHLGVDDALVRAIGEPRRVAVCQDGGVPATSFKCLFLTDRRSARSIGKRSPLKVFRIQLNS
jgi:hypothetical protein